MSLKQIYFIGNFINFFKLKKNYYLKTEFECYEK